MSLLNGVKLPRTLKRSEIAGVRKDLADYQGGKCACCDTKLVRPMLDHNHETGLVRATLCGKCNTAEGKVITAMRWGGRPKAEMAAFLLRYWAKYDEGSPHIEPVIYPKIVKRRKKK